MTGNTTTRRLLTATAVLTLALSGCAGSSDGEDGTAGLPTAEDLDAEGSEVTSGACAEGEPDCEDVAAPGAGGAAGSSCLAGDEDCTDESYGGQDVARPVPLVPAIDDVPTAERGTTSGATGRPIQQAALTDEQTLLLVVAGNQCMLVEDVLVTESPGEVRVLVLGGQDATVDACEDEGLSWLVEVDLAAPLGDRTLLDLAG